MRNRSDYRISIASQCAPPWPSEPRSKPESIAQSLPDVRNRGHRNPQRNQNRSPNRFPMCATVHGQLYRANHRKSTAEFDQGNVPKSSAKPVSTQISVPKSDHKPPTSAINFGTENDAEIYQNQPFLMVLKVKTLPDQPLGAQGSPGASQEGLDTRGCDQKGLRRHPSAQGTAHTAQNTTTQKNI